jgi:hypothetical protein
MMITYETIDLNDYVQTGEGGTALTYNHKDGKTLAKLFIPSVTADTAVREFRTRLRNFSPSSPRRWHFSSAR